MKDEHLSLRTRNKQELTLVFLSASLLGIMATSVLSAGSDAVAQAITSPETIKKKDIFKVIMIQESSYLMTPKHTSNL